MIFCIICIIFITLRSCSNKDGYNNTKNNKLIWFHHIHKSAGSSLVNLAIKNKEKLYYNGNSNGNPKDKIFANKSKEYQQKFIDDALEHKTTFITTEWDFPEPKNKIMSETIIYITMLRNPIDRIISHISHLFRNNETLTIEIDTIANYLELFGNTGTKVLAGHNINYKGVLDDIDYEKAFENLKGFDIILIVENFKKSKLKKLEWKYTKMPNKNTEKQSKKSFSNKITNILYNNFGENWEKEIIDRYCAYDQKLYNYYNH